MAIAAPHSVAQKSTLRPVPQTSDRLVCDFTPTERLAIYDYVVKHTSFDSNSAGVDGNLPFSSAQDNLKPKTLEELLAAERDAKRRRMKYKSKNVHTSKKTQTEILREVIQSQMEGFEEWLLNQQSDSVDKANNTANSKPEFTDISHKCTKNDSSTIKEITRSWDDWHYYTKSNPYTRYLTILQEEHDAAKSKSISDKKSGWSDNHGSTKEDRRNRLENKDYYRSKKEKFHDEHNRRSTREDRNEEYHSETYYSKDNKRERYSQKHYDDWKQHSSRSDDRSRVKCERESYDESKEKSRSSRHSSLSSKRRSDDDYRRHKKLKKHKHKNKHDKKKKSKKSSSRRRDSTSSDDSDST